MNFGDISEEFSRRETARIAVLPVPYGMTSTWVRGAEMGPDAVLAASAHMELYDIETDSEIFKIGIFTDSPLLCQSPPEALVPAVKSRVLDLIRQGKFVVVVGGEHSVSIGSIYAHAETYERLSVLQLDAHADLREEYQGSTFNHACVMARAREVCDIVQVGIRSMSVEEAGVADKGRLFLAKDIQSPENRRIRQAIDKLKENVYLTIDLDVFDPSIMPSTGTPEPGGMSWFQVTEFVENVANHRNIVGFDVVELCPNQNNHSPDFIAAKLIYKTLSYKFGRN